MKSFLLQTPIRGCWFPITIIRRQFKIAMACHKVWLQQFIDKNVGLSIAVFDHLRANILIYIYIYKYIYIYTNIYIYIDIDIILWFTYIFQSMDMVQWFNHQAECTVAGGSQHSSRNRIPVLKIDGRSMSCHGANQFFCVMFSTSEMVWNWV